MIDSNEKHKRQLVFEHQSSRVYEKRIDFVPVGSFSQGAYVFIDNTDSNLHNTKNNISLIATLIRVFSGKKLE